MAATATDAYTHLRLLGMANLLLTFVLQFARVPPLPLKNHTFESSLGVQVPEHSTAATMGLDARANIAKAQ